MGYNWTDEAEKDGRAPKIPAGKHELRIEEIVFERKSGPFISNKGDPQILVVMRDKERRESATMVTLSAAGGWVLAKLLKSCQPSVNLAKLHADGIEPKHFANPDFANSVLIGRQLLCDVAYEKGSDGKEYARLSPLVEPSFSPTKFPTELDKSVVETREPSPGTQPVTVPDDGIPF